VKTTLLLPLYSLLGMFAQYVCKNNDMSQMPMKTLGYKSHLIFF